MAFADPLFRLRLAGLLEGTTLLLLVIVAVPLKHFGGLPQAVSVLGPIHGLVFLLYGAFVVENISGGGWTVRDGARLGLAALIPFGTFLNDGWIERRRQAGTTARRAAAAPVTPRSVDKRA